MEGKRISAIVSKDEYLQMRKSGYSWPQLLRAGFRSLTQPNPLLDRIRSAEEAAAIANARAASFGRRLSAYILKEAEKDGEARKNPS